MQDKYIFDAVREVLRGRKLSGSLTQSEVDQIKAGIKLALSPAPAVTDRLTEKVCLEILTHEAIVRELYKDSKGVWTWSAGITAASGLNVMQFKDNPQSLELCIKEFIALLRKKYAKEVDRAFAGYTLSEAQYAAAVSFHWNTGAIGSATWVASFKKMDLRSARLEFMNWRSPAEIIPRREAERDLFFDGKWSQDGMTKVYEVNKPSYSPRWSSLKRVDIRQQLRAALAA